MRDPRAAGWPDRGERTADPEVAARWVWAYVDLARGEHRARTLGTPRQRRFGPSVEAYLEHRLSTVERRTYHGDRTALRHLQDEFPKDAALTSIDTEKLQRWTNGLLRRGYLPTTLGTYLRSIRAFFRWAGLNPVAGVVLPDPGKHDVATLEPEECEALRTAADSVGPVARLAVEAGLSMGLRQGEIFALRWEDVDEAARAVRVQRQLPDGSLTVKPLKGKLARSALVLPEWWPLHQRGASGLVVSLEGQPVARWPAYQLVRRILDAAKLNGVGIGWHLLRHTYARNFLERGGRLEELQKSLGHASIRTTERSYAHFSEQAAIRLARERIYGA